MPQDPLDFSGRYNTPLSPADEKQFQGWKQRYAPNDTGADYDLRGAFKAGVAPDPGRGHFPDTFKKPNHPTFSDESQYSGKDGFTGGHWGDGTYTASPTNLKFRKPEELAQYFQKNEKGTKLTMPAPSDPIHANPQSHDELPSQADFDASHEAARTKLAGDLTTLGRGPHSDGGLKPPPAPSGYNDVPAANAGPPPAPTGYADIPTPGGGNGHKPLGEQPASFGGTVRLMAHQAGHFLTGLAPDTIKGIYDSGKAALPTATNTDDDKAVKDLVDKKDYLGAAKLLVSKGVEATPGGRFITGAIHNLIDEGGQAVDAYKQHQPAEAAAHAARAIPVVGPLASGLVDTGVGTPEERDSEHNVTKPAVAGDPARALGQSAALVVAGPALEGAARLAPRMIKGAPAAMRTIRSKALPVIKAATGPLAQDIAGVLPGVGPSVAHGMSLVQRAVGTGEKIADIVRKPDGTPAAGERRVGPPAAIPPQQMRTPMTPEPMPDIEMRPAAAESSPRAAPQATRAVGPPSALPPDQMRTPRPAEPMPDVKTTREQVADVATQPYPPTPEDDGASGKVVQQINGKEPPSAEPFKAKVRAARAVIITKLADTLDGVIPPEDAARLSRFDWMRLSKGLGINTPSEAAVTGALDELKSRAAQRAKLAATPAAESPTMMTPSPALQEALKKPGALAAAQAMLDELNRHAAE